MPNPKEPDRRSPATYTLRDLVEKKIELFFECAACGRCTPQDVLDLVARFGPESSIEPLRFHARCTRCQKRRARPLLRISIRRDANEWWPEPPTMTR